MKKTEAELTDILCPICKEALLREDNENKKDGVKQFVCTNDECNIHFRKTKDRNLIDSYFNKLHKEEHVSYETFVELSKEFFANLNEQKEIGEERKYREWRENSKEYIVRYLRDELGITQD